MKEDWCCCIVIRLFVMYILLFLPFTLLHVICHMYY